MSDSSEFPNEGYDEWIDALAAGDGYYLECSKDHWSLPPRRLCPTCGEGGLTQQPLSDSGEIETFTVTHVASPRFKADAPYAVAIASFDGVRITGQVQDVPLESVDTGMAVTADVTESETGGDPVVVFRPR